MKTTRWKLFRYLVIDSRPAQAWLNQMAAEGWALDHIFLGLFARFRPTGRTDLTYFLDWVSPQFPDTPDYLQLCADAGWEPVQTLDYLAIYAARTGASPAPIQTDPALEYQRFQRQVLRHMALGTAIIAGMLLLLFFVLGGLGQVSEWSWRETAAILLSAGISDTFVLLCAPFWLAGGLAYLVLLFQRTLLWRTAAGEGRPLPDPSPRQVRIGSAIRLLGRFSLSALALLVLADALFNGFGTISNAIGALIGFGIAFLLHRENPRLARRGLLLLGWTAALVLCMRLNGILRAEVPGRLPPAPLMEQAQILEEKRSDAVWGSTAKWQEFLSEPTAGAPGSGFSGSLFVGARTWTSTGLAQWAFGPVPAELAAVPGHPKVWRGPTGRTGETLYLLRSDRTQMTLRSFEAISPDQLALALTWLEQA